MSSSSDSASDVVLPVSSNALTNLSTSLRLIMRLLRLLGECTDLANGLVNNLNVAEPEETAPSTPATSTLPSSPSPLSTASMLTVDELPTILIPDTSPPVPATQAPTIADDTERVRQPAPEYSAFASPDPMNLRRVNAAARLLAAAQFNPNGPFSLFIPGKLSLDGRRQIMYNGFLYDIPHPGTTGKLYLITVGLRVGIFASWARAGPHVSRVTGGICVKVRTVEEAEELLHECIDHGTAAWLPLESRCLA